MLCFGQEVFMADKRRQFTREFKLEAVRLVVAQKQPVAAVARHLGIRPDMLRTWRRQLEGRAGLSAQEAVAGHAAPPEEEVRRLRREVERLRQERDFLKKAAAYFAKG
jgi:transposase